MKKFLYTSLLLLLGVVAEVSGQSKTITGGNDHGVIICAQGYLYAWGVNVADKIGSNILGIDESDSETGANAGLKTVYTPSRVKTDNLTFNMVTAGSGAFNLALSCKKIVYGWGDNQQKACSPTEGNLVKYPTPIVKGETSGYNEDGTPGGNYLGGVTYVAASTNSGFAIMDDGRVVGWGNGQWTASADAKAGYPVYIKDEAGNDITNVTHISGGDDNCLIRTADGTLYGVGNYNGNREATVTFAVPVLNDETGEILTDIRMSAAADVAGFAVTGDGYVWSWGNGGWGGSTGQAQEGANHMNARKVSSGQYGEEISGEEYLTDVKEVIGGRGHGAAVTKEGYLVYWGCDYDAPSEAGGGVAPTDETTIKNYKSGPQGVRPILAKYCDASGEPGEWVTDAVSISRGDNFDFMVNSKDEYYVWGFNDKGQAGTGETTITQYNCLTKLETIPCEIQDACPTVFMVDRTKCPGEEIELDCGYVIPKNKEDRYFISWYLDGVLLNSSTSQSDVRDRRADKYNVASIKITEPGTYKVVAEYVGTNIPCDKCVPVETECVVTDMDMPIDTIITDMNCVAEPVLSPTASAVICYEATVNDKFYKSTQTAKFAVFATEDKTDTDTLQYEGKSIVVTAKGSGGKIEFCVTGDQIAKSEVHDNSDLPSKDTTYTVWLEDITSFDTYLYQDKTLANMTEGGFQGQTVMLDMYSSAELKSFDVYVGTHYGSGSVSITPYVYKVQKNTNGQYVLGEKVFTGDAQAFDIEQTGTKCVVNVNYKLEGSSARGVKYFIAVDGKGLNNTGIKVFKYSVTTKSNSVEFATPVEDSEGFKIYAAGATKNSLEVGGGNPGDEEIISNIRFGKLTDYDCGRIMLSARYGCPPCNMPDGNKITISADQTLEEDADGVKSIALCKESAGVKLSIDAKDSNDPTVSFDALWYKGSLTNTAEQCDVERGVSNFGPIAWDETLAGTTVTYYVLVRDHDKPDAATCYVYDSVRVVYNEKPVAPTVGPFNFCENAEDKTMLTAALADAAFTGYTVTWYADDLKSSKTTQPDLETLTAGADQKFYFTITDDATGCESDVETLTITVYSVPDEALTTLEPFCVGDATVSLPTSANGYTVGWFKDKGAATAAEEDLSKLPAASYDYYYTLTSDAPESCVSDPAVFSFVVKDSARLTIDTTQTCGETVAEASNITPTTATLAWSLGGTAVSSPTFSAPTYVGDAGELSVTVSADGYCDNTFTLPSLYVKAVAANPTGTFSVSYLKTDATAGKFKNLLEQDATAVDDEAGYTLVWYDSKGNKLNACPTPDYPADNVTEDQTYTYQVSRINADGCESERQVVKVTIYLTPAPNANPVYYCQNSLNAGPLTAEINDPNNVGTFSLQWYDTDGETKLTAAPTPDVTRVGKTTYYVSQISADGAESSLKEVDVTIYGVKEPTLDASNQLAYCASTSSAAALKASTNVESPYFVATDLVWSLKNDAGLYEEVGTPIPVIDVTETTTHEYKVHQTYTIASTAEVCSGEDVATTVKVTYVPEVLTKEVLYLKASAVGGTFSNNILQQDPEAVTGISTGATLQWYESDCTTEIAGTPTPTLDASVAEGDDQTVTYCVKQVLDGCYSLPTTIDVKISDALPPTVYTYHYCEGQTMTDLQADVNPQVGKEETDYEIYWYGTTKPANTMVTPESVGATYALKGLTAAVEGGKTTTYTYYVAQHDKTTDAVSQAQEVKITVQPKPIVLAETPSATCEEDVDLSQFVNVQNVADKVIYTYYNAENADMKSSIARISGTYYVDAKYDITVPNSVYAKYTDLECRGVQSPVKVVINDLSVPVITGNPTTCPGTSVTLNVASTSTDPGDDKISYTWGGDAAKVAASGINASEYITKDLATTAGAKYSFSVTATAGACTKTTEAPHVVTIGDGQVNGSLSLEEEGNSESPMAFVYSENPNPEFYSCGNPITISVVYEGDGDYVWYKDGVRVTTGAKLVTEAYSSWSDNTYEVRFTNKCEARSKVIVHSLPVSSTPASVEDIEICEGVPFNTGFTYSLKPGIVPVIKWYRDGNELGGETSVNLSIPSPTKDDSGVYTYSISNRGCTSEGTTNKLSVKPYIQAVIQEDPFIVDRHGTQTLPIEYVVPNYKQVETVEWVEKSSTAFTGNPLVLDDVTEDHYYDIFLSDPEFCPDTLKAIVYVDAELQLSTSLKDTMCLGVSDVLTIDTTGTGNFRRPNGNPTLNVTAVIGGGTPISLNDKISKQGDLLKIAVSPADDAVYTIDFTYANQMKQSKEEVIVIPAIQLTLPEVPNICEGSEATLTVTNVGPEGTSVTWTDDPTIIEGANSETVRVKPTYPGGAGHQGTYKYTVTAYNRICDNSRSYVASVLVDEPLKGEVTGDPEICEGKEASLNATAYDASTYVWTPDTAGTMTGARQLVKPTVSTDYVVAMTRGLCSATDSFTVTVYTNPRIASIDSVALRDRQIVLEPGYGTAPFTYAVDAKAADNEDVKKDLTFSKHIVYVDDAHGCTTSGIFMLNPPAISIPEYFTPNGDGTSDMWTIPALADVYPNAVVSIYDRFGKLIAQYLGADSDGWDGTYNGVKLPSTDYWYQITIEEINKEYTGHFTLIRR